MWEVLAHPSNRGTILGTSAQARASVTFGTWMSRPRLGGGGGEDRVSVLLSVIRMNGAGGGLGRGLGRPTSWWT